jgi:hypothetical protein
MTTATKRSCKIIDRETDAAPGLLRIAVDGKASVYYFRLDGDRVRLRKFKAEETYEVCRATWHCSCPAGRHSCSCKHIKALIALTEAKKL